MIHSRLAAWCNFYKQRKAFEKEKSRTLMRKQEIGIGACQKMRKKK